GNTSFGARSMSLSSGSAITVRSSTSGDLWSGFADEARTRPWERDTIINVYSTTKTMTALCALMLADRGELDLHAPVARYWPEFAQNGKGAIEVRHLLSHSSGLSGWEQPLTVHDLYDWEKATTLLAAQAPWWEPGTASGYHSLTQGYLVGEVIRRVSGRSPGTFFREEVAEPLGADFHIGLPDALFPRVADLTPPEGPGGLPDIPGDSVAAHTFRNPPMNALDSRTAAWRRAEIPAAGGHGNARAVAGIHAALANGGAVGGVRLLSAAGCEAVFEAQTGGLDLVLGSPVRFGMGFALNAPDRPLGPNARTCSWGGWGGSIVVIDYDAHMTFSYVMNTMRATTTGDIRSESLGRAVYASLAAVA
ncbi:MAG: serine hydrolase, partial [Chloroflexi bacterium]|nr:serine hydrolase [Chloroflexota bacterium]